MALQLNTTTRALTSDLEGYVVFNDTVQPPIAAHTVYVPFYIKTIENAIERGFRELSEEDLAAMGIEFSNSVPEEEL